MGIFCVYLSFKTYTTMKIKTILDDISSQAGDNAKMETLRGYDDYPLLVDVLYKAYSKRVKFYIKQIPVYTLDAALETITLDEALVGLQKLSDRELTGKAGIAHLSTLLGLLDPDDAYVLERIIEKDLKFGLGTTYINKVFPDLLEKTPYMGAKPFSDALVDKLFANGPVTSDIKMDGRYCNAIIRGGEVDLESRQGEPTSVGDALFLYHLSHLGDCVLNGELTVEGMDRYTANGVIASIVDIEKKRDKRSEADNTKVLAAFVKKHGNYQELVDRIVYTVWDILTVEEYFAKKSKVIYTQRRSILKNIIDNLYIYSAFGVRVALVESKLVKNKAEAFAHFKEALERGLEGTVLKDLDGEWKDGKPAWQVKMKIEITLDLRIMGFKFGKKGTKNENVISTLQTTSSCGLLVTNPSGMDEAMMDFVTANQDELLGTIVEIRCCGLSTDKDGNWSTLHPSVMKLRDDKNTYDSLEDAQRIEEMSKSLN
jgi:DNA ligase-1